MNKLQFFVILILFAFTNFFIILINSGSGKYLINKLDQLIITSHKNIEKFTMNEELLILLRESKNTFYLRHAPKPIYRSAGLQRLSLRDNFLDSEIVKQSSCLSEIGREEARFIGKILYDAKIPIDEVYSSPLCRALETAEIAFRKIDHIENFLLYDGIVDEKLRKSNLQKFKDLFFSVPIKNNRVISAHGHRLKKLGIDFGTDESGIIIYNHELNKVIYVANNLDELAKIYYFLEN